MFRTPQRNLERVGKIQGKPCISTQHYYCLKQDSNEILKILPGDIIPIWKILAHDIG